MNEIPMNLKRWYSLILVMTGLACISACRDTTHTFEGEVEGFIVIPKGTYRIGSDDAERKTVLSHVKVADRDAAQARLDNELDAQEVELGGFAIGATPVLIHEYAAFIKESGHPAPTISREDWLDVAAACGLGLESEQDYDKFVRPLCWREGVPPRGRDQSPVVLVSRDDALAYCAWLSEKLDREVRLPDELESEAAAGPHAYPWGEGWKFDACHASASAVGPAALQSKPLDRCENGVLDYAGQVYEWTMTPQGHHNAILKGGGSWLDGPFDCRRATRRSIPMDARHVLVGFRVVID